MESCPYAMPSECGTDDIAAISGGFMYSPADGFEWSARPACFNTRLERGIGPSYKVSTTFILIFNWPRKIYCNTELSYNVSDEEHLRGIAVIFIQVDCYIDVDYITILERSAATSSNHESSACKAYSLIWYSMRNNIINTGATRTWKTLIR